MSFADDLKASSARIGGTLEAEMAPLPAGAVTEGMRYATNGGKRLRGFLVCAAAELFEAPRAGHLLAAAAIECLHAYSLVHDDLPAMDDDDLRRGQPTVHKKWDDATAILVGDALQTFAFELLARDEVGDPARRVALIRWSAEAGALLAGADPAPLTRYATALGLAFQIADDILDETGDEAKAGKRLHKDAEAGKATFVSLLGLEEAKARARELVAEAVNALALYDDRADRLRDAARFVIARDF